MKTNIGEPVLSSSTAGSSPSSDFATVATRQWTCIVDVALAVLPLLGIAGGEGRAASAADEPLRETPFHRPYARFRSGRFAYVMEPAPVLVTDDGRAIVSAPTQGEGAPR